MSHKNKCAMTDALRIKSVKLIERGLTTNLPIHRSGRW